ncbi:MAG: helix-turn-helix domain-containing protein [Candidatus Nealsonbacteria bacterium]|nr:helix-turn-helix domain-containing protein [Candidatus Nealsonbacteria bacterium]
MVPMKPQPRRRDPDLAGSLSLDQLARRWQVSRKQIRHLLGQQELRFVQIRGALRVPLDEVERYEKKGTFPS